MSQMKPCVNLELNNNRCTCSYTSCSRHGVCCECVAHHLKSRELPQCYVKEGITGR